MVFINAISHPSYSFDTVNPQLFADIFDVGVDDFIVAQVVIIPDNIQQFFPGEYPALVLHQQTQDVKLPGGQSYFFTLNINLLRLPPS